MQIGDASAMPGIIHFDKREDVIAVLDVFASRGYTQIDTARNYPGAEDRLGAADAPARFTIHTKILGMGNETHSPEQIKSSIDFSLKDLKTSSVETIFLHVPDRATPFLDTARAMHEAWQQGKFRRFGLSNYSAAEVTEFLAICDQHGWVKPSVYQGHYNAVIRGAEKELFPLLRKHDMSFFAYRSVPISESVFADMYQRGDRRFLLQHTQQIIPMEGRCMYNFI
jgi:aflatoxin B1 aldehyde reductase